MIICYCLCCFLLSCFIGETAVFFGAFLGPIFALLGFNLFVFVVVIIVLLKHVKRRHVRKKSTAPVEYSIKSGFRLVLSLVGIMVCFGLAWLFGGLTISDGSTTFQFLFVIFNAFQGFYLFIFLVLLSKDARELWMNVIRRKKTPASRAESSLQYKTTRRQASSERTRNTASTGLRTSSLTYMYSSSTLGHSSEGSSTLRRESIGSDAGLSFGTLRNAAVTRELDTVEEGEDEVQSVKGQEVDDIEIQSFTWEVGSTCSSTASQHQRPIMSPQFSRRGSAKRFDQRGSDRDSEVISNPSIQEVADCDEVGSLRDGHDSDSEVVSNQNVDLDEHDSDCVDDM